MAWLGHVVSWEQGEVVNGAQVGGTRVDEFPGALRVGVEQVLPGRHGVVWVLLDEELYVDVCMSGRTNEVLACVI